MYPFTTLGVKSNVDLDTAEKAYRKAAMKHHPDRGGSTTKFQEIQAAWDIIQKGYRDPISPLNSGPAAFPGRPKTTWEKPRAPGNTWRDNDIGNIFEELKAANRAAPNGTTHGNSTYTDPSYDELVANITMREAFAGFSMIVPKHHPGGMVTNSTVHIPPGIPHGYRGKYKISDGNTVTIITRITTGDFTLRGFDNQDNLFSAGLTLGDVELEYDIHVIDIVLGGWIQTKDFLGETLTVRVPAGFNPLHRLKIAGKGYYGWDQLAGTPSHRRQDMYLRLRPLYTKIEELDRQKIINLYQAVQSLAAKDENK